MAHKLPALHWWSVVRFASLEYDGVATRSLPPVQAYTPEEALQIAHKAYSYVPRGMLAIETPKEFQHD